MQTRRSSKAAAAAPSSPPARPGVRRNPPRASRRQGDQDLDKVSRSSLRPPPSSASDKLQKGSVHPPRPSGVRPPSPPPTAPLASMPAPHPPPELPKGLTSMPRKGSIVYDPKARRGAPRRPSLSSIKSSPKRDYYSDEETSIPEPKSAAELLKEEMILRDIEEAECQLRIEAIDSLARDARNVIGQLQDKSRPSYKKVLSMKMQAFKASRGLFTPPGQPIPFVLYDWLKPEVPETTRATVPLAIKLANIATALDYIESLESDGGDPLPFLKAIDNAFPRHFAAEEDKENLSLSLEIRTQRAIESVAALPHGTDKRSALGWVFCETESRAAGSKYEELFQKGPFRPLAGLDPQTLIDVCSHRVLKMWMIMSDDLTRGVRNPVNLASIRDEFPLKDMLYPLRKWLMERFQSISHLMAKIKQDESEKEELRLLEQLREEEEAERRALGEERQALGEERQAFGEERQAVEEERQAKEADLRAREEALAREQRRQQDREQERMRRQDKARDEDDWTLQGEYPSPRAGVGSLAYQQDARESSPESISSSQPEPPPRRLPGYSTSRSLFTRRDMINMLNPEPTHKRSNQSDPIEIESDDDLEVDPRPHKKGKTAASPTIVYRPPPEQRSPDGGDPVRDDDDSPFLADNGDQSQGGHRSASQDGWRPVQTREPATSSAHIYRPQERQREEDPAADDIWTMRPHRLRHSWSEKDSKTLIELIAKRGASWAKIFNEDQHKFDLPRGAQAYRDRARNLKVRFLLNDEILPPAFDLVVLSSKEIDRVCLAKKNPFRRESDVDRYGRPTNTAP
ncbi:hypothetical protein J3F83DRAFT_720408 [Trichoderma novae-zelandiae]